MSIVTYKEHPIPVETIKSFIDPELSEPYSVFTYYYFLEHFPELTYLVVLIRSSTMTVRSYWDC